MTTFINEHPSERRIRIDVVGDMASDPKDMLASDAHIEVSAVRYLAASKETTSRSTWWLRAGIAPLGSGGHPLRMGPASFTPDLSTMS